MALIDKASLLMVPSTYEDGTLYNVLPSGNKAPDETGNHNGYDQTRADFTFSRGSNLAATRVNSDGLIEKGRENLVLQSNQFDTTWAENGSSGILLSGQSGYDGTNDAWQLEHKGSQYTSIRQTISTSGVQTFSVYAKAGTLDYIILYAGAPRAWFDVKNGAVGFTSTVIDTSIEAVSGAEGWYRCSMVFDASATTARIYLNDASGTFGTATGTVFIQDAQLEKGLVATDYIETGSSTAQAGILEDMPRINYDANGENGALLLEPSRTNLITHSEYINGISGLSKIRSSIETNVTTSPEGLSNASLLKEDSSNDTHIVYKDFNLTSGSTYTISIFAKANGTNRNLRLGDGGVGWSSGFSGDFDLTAGTATGGTIESIGSGWYRCSVTGTTNATTSRLIVYSTLGTVTSYQGDGTSGVYLYGFQLEAGSYASSYIPTHGAAVTRGADSCSVTGVSDVIGQSEGTLFMDVNLSARDSYTYFALAPNLGSTTAYIGMGITSTAFLFEVVNSGVQVVYNYPNSNTGNFKMAFAYKANDFVAYVNGTQVMTDTSGSVPSCSQIGMNVFDKDQPLLYKQAVLFNERLSNTELAALTA